MIRLVAQVLDHRQFLVAHLSSDLLHNPRPGHLVRQGGNHHIAIIPFKTGARRRIPPLPV